MRSFTRALLCIAALLQMHCVSSEETGATGGRARAPQRVRKVIPPTAKAQTTPVTSDSTRSSADTVAANPVPRGTPKFATRKDTVTASEFRRSRSTRIDAPIDRPENPEYTIQLGAFLRPENALRAQKRARQQFADQPIFNIFLPEIKLYRVSVGRFTTSKEAAAFRRTILRSFSQEYALCWINYVSR